MVNAGDIVTCQITSQTTTTQNSDSVIQTVSSILAQQGYGVLGTQEQDAGILDTLLSFGYISFQVTMQIQVPTAFAQPTDVLSIVENAFYQATGSYPSSATVTSTQTPGQPVQSTGLPALSPTALGGSQSGVTSKVTGAAGSLGSILTSLGSSTLLLLALLIGVLIFVAGYSPNTRHVVGAFA